MRSSQAVDSGGLVSPDPAATYLAGFAAPLALIGRVMLAAIFIIEGVEKIVHYAEVAAYMQSNQVDARLLPLVIAAELGGGSLVLAGFLTRFAATALLGFCLATALLFHLGADPDQMIQFQKNIAIAGGFLTLVVAGPGAWSIDARRRGRR